MAEGAPGHVITTMLLLTETEFTLQGKRGHPITQNVLLTHSNYF